PAGSPGNATWLPSASGRRSSPDISAGSTGSTRSPPPTAAASPAGAACAAGWPTGWCRSASRSAARAASVKSRLQAPHRLALRGAVDDGAATTAGDLPRLALLEERHAIVAAPLGRTNLAPPPTAPPL